MIERTKIIYCPHRRPMLQKNAGERLHKEIISKASENNAEKHVTCYTYYKQSTTHIRKPRNQHRNQINSEDTNHYRA